jgi:hypothetical protein
MKRKVKRYDKGGILTDRYGNPVKSGSGEPVRTRSDDEIAADSKAGYGRYMPKTGNMTLGKSTTRPSEDLVPPEPAAPSSEFVMQGGKKDTGNEESVKPIVDASGTPTDRLTARDLQSRKAADLSGTKPKRNVVSKKDLEKSGLSLRDYMNKERGLKRKEPKFDNFERTELKSGGKVSSASSRGDGIAQRGKTKGRMC